MVAILLGCSLAGWTEDNEAVSTPAFDRELVGLASVCDEAATCPDSTGRVLTHWVSRTAAGQLFLVLQDSCATPGSCGAWFVERTAQGVDLRLNIDGPFRVVQSGRAIPDVETWRALSDSESLLTRYAWVGGAFLKMETRTVYSVDGVECGSALDCYQAASQAHEQRQTDKALRIWEQVHKVSWI
jgi:hypothetical protein